MGCVGLTFDGDVLGRYIVFIRVVPEKHLKERSGVLVNCGVSERESDKNKRNYIREGILWVEEEAENLDAVLPGLRESRVLVEEKGPLKAIQMTEITLYYSVSVHNLLDVDCFQVFRH